jgi:hypothetical protein
VTAGLPNVHLHDLRRSYATLARRRGIPESVVMKQGGWRTSSVFRRYNIIDEQDVLDAARVMEVAREATPCHKTAHDTQSPGPSRYPAKIARLPGTRKKKAQ